MKSKKESKESKEEKVAIKVEPQAFSQELLGLLQGVEEALVNECPQTVEVKGAAIHLKAAIGSLAQAGKFAKVKS